MTVIEPSVTLEWASPDPTRAIELAARTCYKSQPSQEGSEDFVRRIAIQQGHESVVEHAVASLRIICDRGISHEIVRHRLASYSQESTRYCNYSKEKFGREITVIMPSQLGYCDPLRECRPSPEGDVLCPQCRNTADWFHACGEAEEVYLAMLDRGVSPQVARSVLPTCLKTELVMTANAREWLHFLKLRTAKGAHPDMQVIARQAGRILAIWCPVLFKEYAK